MTDPAHASVFHPGELAVQEAAGVVREAAELAPMIGQELARGAITFLARQPWVVIGTIGDDGWPTASVLYGAPGFLQSSVERTELRINLAMALADPVDPAINRLQPAAAVGVLAIELVSRRRLRINGRVTDRTADLVTVAIDEAYSNCPKYIQERRLTEVAEREADAGRRTGLGPLDADLQTLVTSADTFFIASHGPNGRADVSHRGGAAGFVRVMPGGDLLVPDYPGNNLFNTFGNLQVQPRAGLLFPSFDNGLALQMAGMVRLTFDQADPTNRSGGTERFWRFTPDQWQAWTPTAVTDWAFLEASPYLPREREA